MAIEKELLDRLLAGRDPNEVFSRDGLLDDLKKALSERILNTELDEHLDNESEADGPGNRRNGHSKKTVLTGTSKMQLSIPRDRAGTFDPQLIAKYQRRFPEFDDKIISMYARGMSVREIRGHLEELYGIEVSPDLISAVTDAVLEEVAEWQNRPLDAVYPLVFFDAIRDEGFPGRLQHPATESFRSRWGPGDPEDARWRGVRVMREAWTRRQFLTTASAAAMCSLGLYGCDDAGQAASESARAGQVIFKDLDGRRITLTHPAERIVVLAPPYAAMALAVHGSPGRLAGIHPRARDMFAKSFVSEIFTEVLEIPTNIVVGGDFTPNVEGVARLAPDVVVQWGDLGEALTAPLENAGLTVARYRALPEGPEATLSAMLSMLGEMTGDGGRARRLNTVIGDTSRRLKEAVRALPQGDRQRVLLVTRVGGAFHASGGGSEGLYSYYIYRAGGINVAEALPDYSLVGLEQIAVWDPDVILLFGIQGESPETIYNDPLLRSSKAATSRRVYVLPTGSHYWGALGPEDALAHMWMAELFYPDRLAPMLRHEMRQTYLAMFDRPLSEQQLDKILVSDMNGISAHYDRFH